MKCNTAMHSVIHTADENDSARRVAELMRDENIGFVPVIDADDRVIGVVTDRDLVTRILADDRPGSTPVRHVMTEDVILCHIDDDLGVAEEKLAKSRKERVIVVDSDGHLAGVISMSDLSQTEDPVLVGKLFKSILRREAKGPGAIF
jgi:CBS domain-containing protein